ncbi:MAG: hypothetical protein ACTHU0_21610 [Kofleriaceae bacterium]
MRQVIDPILLGAMVRRMGDRVPAMSLHQPYAGLTAAVLPGADAGVKDIETRAWKMPERWATENTPVLICSAQKKSAEGFERLGKAAHRLPRAVIELTDRQGVTMALVQFSACRPLLPEDEERAWFYEPGRFAFEIARAIPLQPIRVAGRQKIYHVSLDVVIDALRPKGGSREAICPFCRHRHMLIADLVFPRHMKVGAGIDICDGSGATPSSVSAEDRQGC